MKLLSDESGQTLVIVALSGIVLLGFVGLAADAGLMLRQRRMAQTIADAAAMAAATEALSEGTPSTVTTGMYNAAANDAALNGYAAGSTNGTANTTTGLTLTVNVTPNVTIAGFNQAGYVQATATIKTNTFFMQAAGVSSMNMSAAAIASNAINSNGCVYVQNTDNYASTYAVDMGGNSLITGSHCGMTVNGNMNMTGSASVSALFVAVTGSFTGNTPTNGSSGVPPQPDPLFKLQETASEPTIPTGTKAGGACTAPAGSGMSCIYDYNNGVLSGTLQSNTIYYFDSLVNSGGGPSVTGAVTGSNVTLYFAGNIPFDFSNNGNVTITPPGYGSTCVGSGNPLCGILIDAPTDGINNGGTYTCSSGKGNNEGNPGELYFDFGNSTTDLEGIIYAPYMQLFGQDKGSSTTFDTDLVIGNICMQSSTFTVDGFSGSQSPLTRAGLVY